MSNKCTHCFTHGSSERLLLCEECYDTFCSEHASPTQHSCVDNRSVRLVLKNGSVYSFPVDEDYDRRALAVPTTFLRTFLAPVLACDGTRTVLILMWVSFIVQSYWLVHFVASSPEESVWVSIFVLNSANPAYLWTWITSIFSHGGLLHLGVNTIVLAMFGPLAERVTGTKRFLALFFGSAFVASAAEISVAIFVGQPALLLGASGAIAGILGLVATVEPDTRVYLFGLVPTPLWVASVLFSLGSIGVVLAFGTGAFGIAHLAHAGGIIAGIVYGLTRDESRIELSTIFSR